MSRFIQLSSLLLFGFILPAKIKVYSQNTSIDSVQYYISESKKLVYSDFKQAETHLLKAEKFAKKQHDSNRLAEVLYNYGSSYYVIGSYDLALKKYIKASELFSNQNNELGIAKCIMGKGLIQQGFGRDIEALKNFNQSIIVCKKHKDNKFVVKNLLNSSVSYINLKQYSKAYKSLQKSLQISIKNHFENDKHLAMNKIAQIHFHNQQIDSALYYYEKVINDVAKPNLWEQAFAYSGIAETYHAKGVIQKAVENGLKGFQIATQTQAKWDIARAAEILSKIYFEKNDFKNAYSYLEKSKQINDALYADSKLNQINFLQLEAVEAEKKKLETKTEIAQQKLLIIQIFVGFIFILLISLLIFIFQYSKYTKQKEKLYREIDIKNKEIETQQSMIVAQNTALMELNQTKNKLFSVLSHDLKSPINSLLQVIELNKEDDLSKEELDVIYDHLHKQVEGTSLMLNSILSWASSQIDGAKVNFEKVNLNQVVEETINSFYREAFKKKIIFTHEAQNLHFSFSDIGQTKIILQNIMANALKYAPLDSKIEIYYTEENEFQNIHIKDFGVGINQTKIDEIIHFDKRLSSEKGTSMEEGTGLGLLLVKQFLLNNKGKLDVKSIKGTSTEFVISFLKHHA